MTDPGRLVGGRYRLQEVIGAGGMGQVWKAFDESLEVDVAVKEVNLPPISSQEERTGRLLRAQREARHAARLREHPNVVAVHDVLIDDDRPWIIMQLVEGVSLGQWISTRGPLSQAEVATIAKALLSALDAAHEAGIVHRDVKPANVLLTNAGQVLLTDFGIAVHAGDSSLTGTAGVMGSLDYMAPERLRGSDDGAAGDLFSLGATLYHAVQGVSPFKRSDATATLGAVLSIVPDMPPLAGELGPVIMGLLDKDPATRLTAEAVLGLLNGGPAPVAVQSAQQSPLVPSPVDPQQAFASPVGSPAPPVSVPVQAQAFALPSPVAQPQAFAVPNPAVQPQGFAAPNPVAQAQQFASLDPASQPQPFAAPAPPQAQPQPQPFVAPSAGFAVPSAGTTGQPQFAPPYAQPSGSAPYQPTPSVVNPSRLPTRLARSLPQQRKPISVPSLAFSPDGRLLATAGEERRVGMWNAWFASLVGSLSGANAPKSRIVTIAFNHSGRFLAAGCEDGPICIWDVTTGSTVMTLDWHRGKVHSLAFSPDGSRLASGGANGLRIWGLDSGRHLSMGGQVAVVRAVAFSPDGTTLATGSTGGPNGSLGLWDLTTGKRHLGVTVPQGIDVARLVFSPDGRYLATGCTDGMLRMLDARTWQWLHGSNTGAAKSGAAANASASSPAHAGPVTSLAFRSDANVLASGGSDGTVQLWTADAQRKLGVITRKGQRVRSLAFSPDGSILAVSWGDSSVRIYG